LETGMGGISRREWLGLASAAAMVSGAKAAPSPHSLDGVVKAKGLIGFGSGRLRRADGRLKRGSPYDDNYQPKRLRTAIADAFDAAPMRG